MSCSCGEVEYPRSRTSQIGLDYFHRPSSSDIQNLDLPLVLLIKVILNQSPTSQPTDPIMPVGAKRKRGAQKGGATSKKTRCSREEQEQYRQGVDILELSGMGCGTCLLITPGFTFQSPLDEVMTFEVMSGAKGPGTGGIRLCGPSKGPKDFDSPVFMVPFRHVGEYHRLCFDTRYDYNRSWDLLLNDHPQSKSLSLTSPAKRAHPPIRPTGSSSSQLPPLAHRLLRGYIPRSFPSPCLTKRQTLTFKGRSEKPSRTRMRPTAAW